MQLPIAGHCLASKWNWMCRLYMLDIQSVIDFVDACHTCNSYIRCVVANGTIVATDGGKVLAT